MADKTQEDLANPQRRTVLNVAWKAGATVLLLEGLWTTIEALKPLAQTHGGGKLVLGPPGAYAEQTATYIRSGRFYVTRVKGKLFALSQTCPHLGCRVPFCDASGRFECPCHGSKYTMAGEWLEGPSPHGMNRHPIAIENDQVVVDTGEIVQGPELGANEFFTPARGGRCEIDES